MKEPPFRTVPTFVPCNQHIYFLADQGEKLFQVWKPGLNFSLLGLAPEAGLEPATWGLTVPRSTTELLRNVQNAQGLHVLEFR